MTNTQIEFDNVHSGRARLNVINVLIILYLFWLVTSPQYSTRLAFLAEIKFEKILAITLIILTLFMGRIENIFRPLSMAVLILFGWMLICDLFSSYPDASRVLLWRETYWKKIAFFVVVAIGLRKVSDVHIIAKALFFIVFFYQLYSWFDFLRGGAYVYQQGMKRMIGSWTNGDIGSANGFGFLGAFALPFATYSYRTASTKRAKLLAFVAGGVAFMSIIFSGTRGAVVVAILYILIEFRAKLIKPKPFLFILLLMLVAVPMLPEKIQHRYWGLLFGASYTATDSKSDEVAIESGMSRIQGLKDGFAMAFEKPVFGFGPATSGIARAEKEGASDELNLELHNMYGQLPAELGFVGFGIWIGLLSTFLIQYRRFRLEVVGERAYSEIGKALIGGFFIFVFYGVFNHSAYDIRMLFLLAMFVALQSAFQDSRIADFNVFRKIDMHATGGVPSGSVVRCDPAN